MATLAECLTKLTKAYPTAKIFYGVSGHTFRTNVRALYRLYGLIPFSGSVPTQGWPCFGPFDTPDRAAYGVDPTLRDLIVESHSGWPRTG